MNSIGILQNDEIVWVNLDEIDVLIIESQYCNTSIRLFIELIKKGITLILCSENHMSIACLNSLISNQRAAKYNKLQVKWQKKTKQIIWKYIIKHKIYLQVQVLKFFLKTDKIDILLKYIDEVKDGDITNREGLAAKIYFRELFGNDFIRTRNADDICNSCLNYLYQVVRSKISQEIIARGYKPSLGIFHCSEYNYFCLADDIIEVFRPILDYYIIRILLEDEYDFLCTQLKEKLLEILLKYVLIKNVKHKILESIKLIVVNIIDVLTNENISAIILPEFNYEE